MSRLVRKMPKPEKTIHASRKMASVKPSITSRPSSTLENHIQVLTSSSPGIYQQKQWYQPQSHLRSRFVNIPTTNRHPSQQNLVKKQQPTNLWNDLYRNRSNSNFRGSSNSSRMISPQMMHHNSTHLRQQSNLRIETGGRQHNSQRRVVQRKNQP